MALEFNDVRHAYGDVPVLDGVSFEARYGEVCCLVGASGSGKTTLLRLAAGILKVQSGTIRLDGEVVADPDHSPPPEARNVGLVFQEGALFPHLNVEQNVGYGLRADPNKAVRVRELLELVGLSDFASRRPHELSGGQQQRVSLARALAPSPRVLLMDEPFGGLDSGTRGELRLDVIEILKRQNVATILVTHDPEEAMETGDQIVCLERGHIVQSGPRARLFEHPATAKIAQTFCKANVVEGMIGGDEVMSDLGRWPRACLRDPSVRDGPAMLAVLPDDLRTAPAASQMKSSILDRHAVGRAVKLLGRSAAGTRWTLNASLDETAMQGDAVELIASAGSVLAYPTKASVQAGKPAGSSNEQPPAAAMGQAEQTEEVG